MVDQHAGGRPETSDPYALDPAVRRRAQEQVQRLTERRAHLVVALRETDAALAVVSQLQA